MEKDREGGKRQHHTQRLDMRGVSPAISAAEQKWPEFVCFPIIRFVFELVDGNNVPALAPTRSQAGGRQLLAN